MKAHYLFLIKYKKAVILAPLPVIVGVIADAVQPQLMSRTRRNFLKKRMQIIAAHAI
jgi:hypothetical protein